MSAGAIAVALFGGFTLYGGLAYCIYKALKKK
ncbi:MAG TPA: MetS family NSS transporter small subunit [Thermoplasmatales archaeon]|nr:MetS family NSS transporter small subunit [Thermoplasmatales archaeon]